METRIEPFVKTEGRILIESRSEPRYFSTEGSWSPERERAAEFPSTSDALKFIRQKGIRGVNLVVSFPDPALDIRLPGP
jgi:hypothetical protein